MDALIARVHAPLTALGPGLRAGIWFQGCTIHCPGCISADTWAFDEARRIAIDRVLEWVEQLPQPVNGVTITGGEPFDQADALLALLQGLRRLGGSRLDADRLGASGLDAGRLDPSRLDADRLGASGLDAGGLDAGGHRADGRGAGRLDVLCYSGYEASHLREHFGEALTFIDVLAAGPYRAAEPSRDPLLGSANQELIFLTELGRARFAASPARAIDVGVDGAVWMVGVPRRGDLPALTERLEQRGVHLRQTSWSERKDTP